jgi:hypothetical protein
MYVKVNVAKPTRISPGKGGDKMAELTLVDANDVLTLAQRDSKGIKITGNHVFKPGAYAIKLYVTQDSIAGKATSEGEIDAEGIMQEIVVAHPGSAAEIREFRSNWLNRDAIAFVKKCSDNTVDQYGDKCAVLRMKFEHTDDKDQNKTVFTFASAVKGPDIAIYEGTLTLAEPVALVDADATTINLTAGEGEYQLQDNTGATVITTCTNATDGLVFTLIGSGGTNPASISGGDFVLKNGTAWSGLVNATITFKAFKDGAATWKFFELSRS